MTPKPEPERLTDRPDFLPNRASTSRPTNLPVDVPPSHLPPSTGIASTGLPSSSSGRPANLPSTLPETTDALVARFVEYCHAVGKTSPAGDLVQSELDALLPKLIARGSEVIPKLTPFLERDREDAIRQYTILVLGLLHSPDVALPLVTVVESDPEIVYRYLALRALYGIAHPELPARLVAAFRSDVTGAYSERNLRRVGVGAGLAIGLMTGQGFVGRTLGAAAGYTVANRAMHDRSNELSALGPIERLAEMASSYQSVFALLPELPVSELTKLFQDRDTHVLEWSSLVFLPLLLDVSSTHPDRQAIIDITWYLAHLPQGKIQIATINTLLDSEAVDAQHLLQYLAGSQDSRVRNALADEMRSRSRNRK